MVANTNFKIDVFSFYLYVYFFLTYSKFVYNDFKYLKYVYPLLFVFVYFSSKKVIKLNFNYLNSFYYVKNILIIYFSIYVTSLLIQLFTSNSITIRYFSNVYFVLSPLISVLFLCGYFDYTKISKYFKIIFFGSVIGFFLEQGSSILSSVYSFDFVSFLLFSQSDSESNIYPFVFSFLFFYSYLTRQPKFYLFTCLVLIFFGSKRIVFAGLVFVFFVILLSWKNINFLKYRKLIPFLLTFLSLIIILLFFQFSSGTYDYLIEYYTGLSSNQFSMGRQSLYSYVIDRFESIDIITGTGIGTVDNQVSEFSKFRELGLINNLHSELLRNFLELGLLLFCVWIYFISKFSIRGWEHFYFLLFFFFSLISDNILIYFECTFIMYLLLVFLNFNKNPDVVSRF